MHGPKSVKHPVYVRISHYFRCKFKSSQHGFIKLKSTTNNLVTYLDLSPLDSSHSHVDATHFELRCAFDLEPHSVLPYKVCVSGFSDGYVNRSRTYLTSRQAAVYVLRTLKSHFEELASVKQGPVPEAPAFPILLDTICI